MVGCRRSAPSGLNRDRMLAACLYAVQYSHCSSSMPSDNLSCDVRGSACAAPEPFLNSSWHSQWRGLPFPGQVRMWTCTGPAMCQRKYFDVKMLNESSPGNLSLPGGFVQKDLQLTLKTKGGDAATFRSILPWSR